MRTRTRVHYSASAAPGGYPAELSVPDGMSEVAGTLLQPELTGHSALGSGSHRSGPCADEIATMLSPLDGAADAACQRGRAHGTVFEQLVLSPSAAVRHARTTLLRALRRRAAPQRALLLDVEGAKLPRRDRLEAWSQSAAVVGVFSKARRPA